MTEQEIPFVKRDNYEIVFVPYFVSETGIKMQTKGWVSADELLPVLNNAIIRRLEVRFENDTEPLDELPLIVLDSTKEWNLEILRKILKDREEAFGSQP